MKAYKCLISLALVFFLLKITTGKKSLINSTCLDIARNDPNIDYAFCTSSLQAAPASSDCATRHGLATVSITLLRSNITDIYRFIKNLLIMNKTSEPYLRRCLSDCFELFSDAIPTVEQAMRYYTERTFDDANVEISSILDGAATCEDGFTERRGMVSLLTERNHNTFELSAIALSLIHIFQTQTG